MPSRSSRSPGQAEPTPEPPGAVRAHFDRPGGQTLAAPGEPGVAQRVPDRGDDPLELRRVCVSAFVGMAEQAEQRLCGRIVVCFRAFN